MSKKYKLGETVWKKFMQLDTLFEWEEIQLSEETLLKMGAIPLTDEPEQIEELDHYVEVPNEAINALSRISFDIRVVNKINELVRAINSLTEERKR